MEGESLSLFCRFRYIFHLPIEDLESCVGIASLATATCARHSFGVFATKSLIDPTWHQNAYTRRRRARTALANPLKHSKTRLQAAASLLHRHHGSTIPVAAKYLIMGGAKKFLCKCGWKVSGKVSVAKAKADGDCGCGIGGTLATTNGTAASPKAAAGPVVKPTTKVQGAGGPAPPAAKANPWSPWATPDPAAKATPAAPGSAMDVTAEPDAATEAEELANRTAELKEDEACCKAQIKAASGLKGPLAAETLRRAEEQLKAIQSQIRMSKPVTIRLKEMQKSEAWFLKQKGIADERHAKCREDVKTALAYCEQAKLQAEQADEDLRSAKDLVAQATMEKADYDASRLGVRAGDILNSLATLAAQCGSGPLGDHLRQAIVVASVAEATVQQTVGGNATPGGPSSPPGAHSPTVPDNSPAASQTNVADAIAAGQAAASAAIAATHASGPEQHRLSPVSE